MKKIILFVLLFSVYAAHSQDSTKLTAKQVYNDVKAGFDRLVNNLSGPAKYTYESYVAQYKIDGWATLAGYIISFVILLPLVIISFKRGKWENGEVVNKWAVGQVACTIILCGFMLVFILSIGTIATEIFNPQYHAIQEIIKTLK